MRTSEVQLRMELPGKKKRRRAQRRFMDMGKEDMLDVTEEDAGKE